MNSLHKPSTRSPSTIYAILTGLLLLLTSPILYYGYQDYQIRAALNNVEHPNTLLANRYIQSGDWPASSNDNTIISNAYEFQLSIAENMLKSGDVNDKK